MSGDTSIAFTTDELAALRARAAELGQSVHDYVLHAAAPANDVFVAQALQWFERLAGDPSFAEADRVIDAA